MEAYEPILSEQEIPCPGCGITLRIPAGKEEVWCEYCRQMRRRPKNTGALEIPAQDDLLARADRDCDRMAFDEALAGYRLALLRDPADLHALWGLIRCRYGARMILDENPKNRYLLCARRTARPVESTAEYRSFAEAAGHARNKREAAVFRQYLENVCEQQKRLRALWSEGGDREYDVFLCYRHSARGENGRVGASRDRAWVARFYKEMQRQIAESGGNIRVFYAPETLKNALGAPYAAEIAHALFTSRVMLLMASEPQALTSRWVQAEAGQYRWLMEEHGLERLIIPVLNRSAAEDPSVSVETVFPQEYSRTQAVLFGDSELREAVGRVIAGIQRMNHDGDDSLRRSRKERAYDGLLAEKEQLTAQVADLQESLQQACLREKTVIGERERVRGLLDKARRDQEENERDLTQSRQTAEVFQNLYGEMSRRCEDFRKALGETQTELNGIRKELADARAGLGERDEEIGRLREELADRPARDAMTSDGAALEDARKTIREQQAALDRARADYRNRGAELSAARHNAARMESELSSLQDENRSLKETCGDLRRQVEALKAAPPPPPPPPPAERAEPAAVQLRGYGFRSMNSGGVINALSPDLRAEKDLRHPERIRWIAANLYSPMKQSRVRVRLSCEQNGFDDVREATLPPKRITEVLFDIDGTQIARYSGTYQLTVTDIQNRELLSAHLVLRGTLP